MNKNLTNKDQKIVKGHFNALNKYLRWILYTYVDKSVSIKLFLPLLAKLEKIGKTRGSIFLIKYLKDVRQALLLHLSGEYPLKRVKGVGVYKSGMPKVLGFLGKTIIDKKISPVHVLRITLTILFSTRALKLGKIPDISSIIEYPKGSDSLSQPMYSRGAREAFWRAQGLRNLKYVPKGLCWKDFHLTTKSGPNGHALLSSLEDLKVIRETDLLEDIKILGGKEFTRLLERFLPDFEFFHQQFPVKGRNSYRKIAYFPDRELKTRVVAIGDYWSQTVLKPLHNYLFRILRKIPQDTTFDQGSFKEKTLKWDCFYSIDLTAATDRFPIKLERFVLEGILPSEYVQAWQNVMTKHPFDYRAPKQEGSSPLTYNAGNPMGFYSSWNSFAIAHHYVMFVCCRELNIPWKEAKYFILGDDVLIGDHRLAQKYKEYILALGVKFSPLKTHESNKLFEFAKRYVLNGEEITPFPISALKESQRRYYLLVNLLQELEGKGWVALNGIPTAVVDLSWILTAIPRSRRKVMLEKSTISGLVMKMTRGKLSADDLINQVIGLKSYQLEPVSKELGKTFFNAIAVQAFADSMITYERLTKEGGIASKLGKSSIKIMMGDPQFIERRRENMKFVPVRAVMANIWNDYHNLVARTSDIVTSNTEEWPLLLRAVALPLDSKVFVERQSHTISRTSAIFADKLINALKEMDKIVTIPELTGPAATLNIYFEQRVSKESL